MKKVGQSGYIGIVVHKLNPKARIFKIIFYWTIVALQFCVSFCCIANESTMCVCVCIYIYIYRERERERERDLPSFLDFLPFRSPQSTE